jgi:predicted protein tyrosine phosphatase
MSDEDKLTIEVLSREEAGNVLSSASGRKGVCFLISIGEPENQHPAGYANVPDRLRLHFSDTLDDRGPSEEHVEELIAAAKRISHLRGRVVAHCEAGISRSSAAAIVIYSVLLGPGKEREAFQRVLQQRPIARPNRRMLEIADRLLERNGALIAALEESSTGG